MEEEAQEASLRAWEPSARPGEPLRTVAFLREHNVDELCETFGVRARPDKTLPLVLFKYQQLSAPFHRAVTRECRGLVLEQGTWKVVCYPYDKFFNVNEPHSKKGPQLDWSTVRCYEKLDGSLATLYHYRGEWMVASSGTPTGDGLLTETETFAQIFWEVWRKEKYDLPKDTSLCYIFEMISKKNPIVVVVQEDELILHGVRSLKTMKEQWPEEIAATNKWKCVRAFPLQSFEQIDKACRALNPHENEGFVVADAKFARRKLKSPAYVGLSLLSARDTTNNDSNMLRIVRQNENDEFLAYFPQWTGLCEYVRERYLKCIATLAKRYREPMGDESSPDLAALFAELKRKGIAQRNALDLALREWYAEVELKRAIELLDWFAPENQTKRSDMMRKQKMVFEQMGIDSSKKKKKKKKKKKSMPDAGYEDEEEEEEVKPAPSKQHSKKDGWEVVDKKKSRRKKIDPIDALIEEFRVADLQKARKKKGK